MPPDVDHSIRHWSTADVAPGARLDYFAAALSESVLPMGVDDVDPYGFHGQLSTANLGEIRVTKASGTAHKTFRGRAELSRSTAYSFNVLIGLTAPWTAQFAGQLRLMPRDVLLFDSERPITTDVREDFSAVSVSVSESWLRRWVPDPSLLTERHISGSSLWGTTLSAYLSRLTPSMAASPPLPLSVIADQVGSLLALTANAIHLPSQYPRPAIQALHARIEKCIIERCTELDLVAADIASSLGISVRTLHRALAAAQKTFGFLLIDARASNAMRMLKSPLFKRVTTAEIGRRAGFFSASHFTRVIRARTAMSPRQFRIAAAPAAPHPEDDRQ